METEPLKEKFRLGGEIIELCTVHNKTFLPNQTTEVVYGAVEINEGDIGIEIGAGIGAGSIILARKLIKHLYTVEIIPEQCDLQIRNFELYEITNKVTVSQGNLFDPIRTSYPELRADFIVSDVSGMNDLGVELGWYPQNIPRGGEDGTENVVPFLREAKCFLKNNQNSRVYFPIVENFSDGKRILDVARDNYGKLEKITERKIPLKQEQLSIIDNSKHRIFEPINRRGSRGFWKVEVYKAMEPVYRAT